MIQYDKPQNLNGSELLAELQSAGVAIDSVPLLDADGNLWLDITTKDQTKAKTIVDSHNGTIVSPEPTVADKLASVGLNLDDLKSALGI